MRYRLLVVVSLFVGVVLGLPTQALANDYWISEYLHSSQSGVAADFYAYDWSVTSGGMQVSSCYMWQWDGAAYPNTGPYFVEAGLVKQDGVCPTSWFWAFVAPYTYPTEWTDDWPVTTGQTHRFHIKNPDSGLGIERWTMYCDGAPIHVVDGMGFAKGLPDTLMERHYWADSGNHRATLIRYLSNSTMTWAAWPGMNRYDQDDRFDAVVDGDNAWHTAFQ
jgi:hypothetical protein